jgi:hypothetical protein
MKKIILIVICFSFFSCGSETVTITENDPFVIKSISIKRNGNFVYSRGEFKFPFKEFFARSHQRIVSDKNLNYKIGDTLSIVK